MESTSSGHGTRNLRVLNGEALEQLTAFQKQGYFESFDAAGLTAHGGDMNGFILLKGERAKLDELRRTDEFERFSMTHDDVYTDVIKGVCHGYEVHAVRADEVMGPGLIIADIVREIAAVKVLRWVLDLWRASVPSTLR